MKMKTENMSGIRTSTPARLRVINVSKGPEVEHNSKVTKLAEIIIIKKDGEAYFFRDCVKIGLKHLLYRS